MSCSNFPFSWILSVLLAPRAFAPPTSLYAPQSESTQPHLPPPMTSAPLPAPVAIRRTETADEVYARRLAMSTGQAPPTFTPSVPSFTPSAPSFIPSAPTFTGPTIGPSFTPAAAARPSPSFVKAPSDIPPPSAAPAPYAPPPTEPLQPDTPDFQKALETRRLAAEAIAKRLAAAFPQPVVPGIGAYAGPVREQKEVDTSGMDAGDVVDLLARQVERDAGGEEKGTFAERSEFCVFLGCGIVLMPGV